MEERCHECDRGREVVMLRKCPSCHRYFCEDHSATMSGRPFCSRNCAYTFFFPDDDD